jgi:hypothetical protein
MSEQELRDMCFDMAGIDKKENEQPSDENESKLQNEGGAAAERSSSGGQH